MDSEEKNRDTPLYEFGGKYLACEGTRRNVHVYNIVRIIIFFIRKKTNTAGLDPFSLEIRTRVNVASVISSVVTYSKKINKNINEIDTVYRGYECTLNTHTLTLKKKIKIIIPT